MDENEKYDTKSCGDRHHCLCEGKMKIQLILCFWGWGMLKDNIQSPIKFEDWVSQCKCECPEENRTAYSWLNFNYLLIIWEWGGGIGQVTTFENTISNDLERRTHKKKRFVSKGKKQLQWIFFFQVKMTSLTDSTWRVHFRKLLTLPLIRKCHLVSSPRGHGWRVPAIVRRVRNVTFSLIIPMVCALFSLVQMTAFVYLKWRTVTLTYARFNERSVLPMYCQKSFLQRAEGRESIFQVVLIFWLLLKCHTSHSSLSLVDLTKRRPSQ